MYGLVVLCETNVLNLISQRLDTIYQIKPKRATIFFLHFFAELNTPFVSFFSKIPGAFSQNKCCRLWNFQLWKVPSRFLCESVGASVHVRHSRFQSVNKFQF
jgi:hypothetical protein